jgi:isorenieratene synthase
MTVEHGFHAFFRQYYNLRAWLRRLDPDLAMLRPVGDYPVIARGRPAESFARIPRQPPANLLGLVAASPSLRTPLLARIGVREAMSLLAFDRERTFAFYDDLSAAAFLDRLCMPPAARSMLFDVFARSVFNDPAAMSAAELLSAFHVYFLGNPEGLLFDAVEDDYENAVWKRVEDLLARLQVDVRTQTRAASLERTDGRWSVRSAGGASIEADRVVLATDVASLRRLVQESPGLVRSAPRLATQSAALRTAAPYVVSRLWLDRDVAPNRPAFAAVAGEPTLDVVALVHRLQRSSALWAQRRGGSGARDAQRRNPGGAVVECHGYAASPGLDARTLGARLYGELVGLWPEVGPARILDSATVVRDEAPAYPLGGDRLRPGVLADAPGILLAGDGIATPHPCALMERAASTGLLATNAVLESVGVSPEPVCSVPARGLLAGTRLARG